MKGMCKRYRAELKTKIGGSGQKAMRGEATLKAGKSKKFLKGRKELMGEPINDDDDDEEKKC